MKQALRMILSALLATALLAGTAAIVWGAGTSAEVRDEVNVKTSVTLDFGDTGTTVLVTDPLATNPEYIRVSSEGFEPTESETSIRFYQYPSSLASLNPLGGYAKHSITSLGGHDRAFVASYDPADPDYAAEGAADLWSESDLSLYPSALLAGAETFDYATVSFDLYLEGLKTDMVLRLESTPKYRLVLIHPVSDTEAEVYMRQLNTNAQDSPITSDLLVGKVSLGAWHNFSLDFVLQSGTLGFYDYNLTVDGELCRKGTYVNGQGETVETDARGHMDYFATLESVTSNTALTFSSTRLRFYVSRPDVRPTAPVTWGVDNVTVKTVDYTGEPAEVSVSAGTLRAVETDDFVTVWESSDYGAESIVNVRPQGIRINGCSAVFFDLLTPDAYVWDEACGTYVSSSGIPLTLSDVVTGDDGKITSFGWQGKTYLPENDVYYCGTKAAPESLYTFAFSADNNTVTVRSLISTTDPTYQLRGTYPTDSNGRFVTLGEDGDITLTGLSYAAFPLYRDGGSAYLTYDRAAERFRITFEVWGEGVTGVTVCGQTVDVTGLAAETWNTVTVEVAPAAEEGKITVSVNGAATDVDSVAYEKPVLFLQLADTARLKGMKMEEYLTLTEWRDADGNPVSAARAAYIRYCESKSKLSAEYSLEILDGTIVLDGTDFNAADVFETSVSADGATITLGGAKYTRDASNEFLFKASDTTTLLFDPAASTLTRTFNRGDVTVMYFYCWNEDKTQIVLQTRLDTPPVSLAQLNVGLSVDGSFYQNSTVNVFALYDDKIKVNGVEYASEVLQYAYALTDTALTWGKDTYVPANSYKFQYNYERKYLTLGSDAYDAQGDLPSETTPVGTFVNTAKGITLIFSDDGTTVTWKEKSALYDYTYTVRDDQISLVPKNAAVPQGSYECNGAKLAFAVDGTVKVTAKGGKAITYVWSVDSGRVSLRLTGVKTAVGNYKAADGSYYDFPEKPGYTADLQDVSFFDAHGKEVKYKYTISSNLARLTLIDLSAQSSGRPEDLEPTGTYSKMSGSSISSQITFDPAAGTVELSSGGKTFVQRYRLNGGASQGEGTFTARTYNVLAADTLPAGGFLTDDALSAVVFDGTSFSWTAGLGTMSFGYAIGEDMDRLTLTPDTLYYREIREGEEAPVTGIEIGYVNDETRTYTVVGENVYSADLGDKTLTLTFDPATLKMTWREDYDDGTAAVWTFRYSFDGARTRISLLPTASDYGTNDRIAVRPVKDVQFQSATYYPGAAISVNSWGTSLISGAKTDVTYWGSSKPSPDETTGEETNGYLKGEVGFEVEEDGAFVTKIVNTGYDHSYTYGFQANLKKKDGVKEMKQDMVAEYFSYTFSIWYDGKTFPDGGFLLYMTAPNALNSENKHNFAGQRLLQIVGVDGVPYLIIPRSRYGQLYDDNGNYTLNLEAPSPDTVISGKSGDALLEALRTDLIAVERTGADSAGILEADINGYQTRGTRSGYDQLNPRGYLPLAEAVVVELDEGWNSIEMHFEFLGERTSNDYRSAGEGTTVIPSVDYADGNYAEGEAETNNYIKIDAVTHAYFRTNFIVNDEYVTYNDNPDDPHNADFVFDNGQNPCAKEAYMQGQATLTSNGTETDAEMDRIKVKDFELAFLSDHLMNVNSYEKGTEGDEILAACSFDARVIPAPEDEAGKVGASAGKYVEPRYTLTGGASLINTNDRLQVSFGEAGTATLSYDLSGVAERVQAGDVTFDVSLYTDRVDYSANKTVAENLRWNTVGVAYEIAVGSKTILRVDGDGTLRGADGSFVTQLKDRGWNRLSAVLEKQESGEYLLTVYVGGEILCFREEAELSAGDCTSFTVSVTGGAGTSTMVDDLAVGVDNIPSSLVYMHPVSYDIGAGQGAHGGLREDYHIIGQKTTLFPEVGVEGAVFTNWYFDSAFSVKAKKVKESYTAPVDLHAGYAYYVSYDVDRVRDTTGKPIKTPAAVSVYGDLILPTRSNVAYWYAIDPAHPESAVYVKCGETYFVQSNLRFKAADPALGRVIDFLCAASQAQKLVDAGANYMDLHAVVAEAEAALAGFDGAPDTEEFLAAYEGVPEAVAYAKANFMKNAHDTLDTKIAQAQDYLTTFAVLSDESETYARRWAAYLALAETEDENGKTWKERLDVTVVVPEAIGGYVSVSDANGDMATFKTTLERAKSAAVALIEAYHAYAEGTFESRKERFAEIGKLLDAYEYCFDKASIVTVRTVVPTADDFLYDELDKAQKPTGNTYYSVEPTHLALDGENTVAGYLAKVREAFVAYNDEAREISQDMAGATVAVLDVNRYFYRHVWNEGAPEASGTVPAVLPAAADDLKRRLDAIYVLEDEE